MDAQVFFLLGALLLGAISGYIARRSWALRESNSLEGRARQKLDEAESRAKEIVIEAKEKAASIVVESQNEERKRKDQLGVLEARLFEREKVLDKKFSSLTDDENALKERVASVEGKEKEVSGLRGEVEKLLERASGLSRDAAREELIREVKETHQAHLAQMLQKLEKEMRDEVEKRAGEIVVTALQRYARSHVSELTTTSLHLENEELKGKIIGREGRNIRALERATGVEFVIDETPDSVLISSFDPYRREVARIALLKLIKDGRIQPAKIEEKVEEARQELERRTLEIGETTATEVGVYGLPKEILQLLGRLHFRTSYGQNVLVHSVEMAYIASMMAAELGLNAEVAKKAALLHDIGKAIDHEVEGTHVELGRKILKKYGVEELVIQAMQSHHEDYPYETPEAFVVTTADVLSAARPGARRDNVENYIKRLGDLEKIAMEFPGVKQSYAISAGRELRVFVVPEKIDDFGALDLARNIANRIQSELKYPGEIKVNVIREMRAVEYAR